MSSLRESVAATLICVTMTGCVNAQIERAKLISDYNDRLERCKQNGKAAGWYAVYEVCAKAVDQELCVEQGVRCRDAEGKYVDAPR